MPAKKAPAKKTTANRQTRRAVTKVAGGRTTPKKAAPTHADITSAEEWVEQAEAEHTGVPIQLPSGKTCLAHPVDIMTFLRSGRIPNPLMPFIEAMIVQAEGKRPPDPAKEAKKFTDDLAAHPENFNDLLEFVDMVVLEVVEKPEVRPVPKYSDEPGSKYYMPDMVGEPVPYRNRERALYIDMVDLEDRFFLFNFAVGGTREVERFRDDLANAPVGSVRAVQSVGGESE